MVYSAAKFQKSNTYQYPTDKKVRKLFKVPTYFGTTLYMFRTVSPYSNRSLRMYIQHQVYVIQVLWLLASKQPQDLYVHLVGFTTKYSCIVMHVPTNVKIQHNSLWNSRRGDGSHGILVQVLNQFDDLVTCHGRFVELFVDVRTVAMWISSRHMNHRLHQDKRIPLGTKAYWRNMWGFFAVLWVYVPVEQM